MTENRSMNEVILQPTFRTVGLMNEDSWMPDMSVEKGTRDGVQKEISFKRKSSAPGEADGLWKLHDIDFSGKKFYNISRNKFIQQYNLVRFCCSISTLKITRISAKIVFILMLWGVVFCKLGSMATPQGQLFKLGVLGVVAHLSGSLVSLVGITPLLGMMVAGTVLRSVGFMVFTGPFLEVSATIREVALIIILIRAGLELDPGALKRLGCIVLGIAILPAVVEAVCVATLTHFLLDLPWIWGFLLGAVLAAVSPDVVIPCLFNVQAKGNYGVSKGIPTVIIAAASFDDVIAISVFGVLLGIITSTGNLTSQIVECPLGLLIGVICGVCLGMLFRYIPHQKDSYVTTLRTFLLVVGGMFIMFGSETIGYDAAGPIGCILTSFIAGKKWDKDLVEKYFSLLMAIFQPFQFGLIGSEVDVFLLDGKIVGLGIVSLLISLAARIAISILVAVGGNFDWKEKLFISFAWFPKATVQAALGPIALDEARKMQSKEYEGYANIVLVISVLSILITAPIGATLITLLGPVLLKKETQDTA